MDQRRFFLLVIFAVSLMMLWTRWNEHNTPATPPPSASTPSAATPATAPDDSVPTFGDVDTPSAATPVSSPSQAPRLKVLTDVMSAEISAEGGNLVRLELLKHHASDNPEKNFLIFDDGTAHIFEAESGLRDQDKGVDLPNHRTLFKLPAEGEQRLADGQEKLVLRLEAPVVDGVAVTKVMTFTRGSHVIDIDYEIRNQGSATLNTKAYFQFLRDGKPAEQGGSGFFGGGVQTFTGPAFYTEKHKFQKVSFGDIDENKAKHADSANDGWVAIIQHYFVSAWLPPEGVSRDYFTRKISTGNYTAGVRLGPVTVEPGGTAKIGARLYAGPQDQNSLENIAPGLRLVVDYGVLTIIAAPLFWLLSLLHSLIGNWGWAIIFVTIIIKAAFFPLSATSYKSMAKMRVLAPRLQRLKELYGNDKAKMQQEMMNLYRTEKINPLGGCLPILVQIPVFLALYWVLLGSVEMRQAPWLGWIQDLSAPDPYYILPIIMGASMLIQTKLNPSPPDPMQARIMMALPIIFTVMFLWFPSGLVLYWVVNNLLSIAQQWQITRMIERGGDKKTRAANDSKV
jgi:YidC/Oxa1 family membrane protein insertase